MLNKNFRKNVESSGVVCKKKIYLLNSGHPNVRVSENKVVDVRSLHIKYFIICRRTRGNQVELCCMW